MKLRQLSGAELNCHSFLTSIFFQIKPPLSKHCATQVTKIGVLIATLLFCRHHVFGNGHWGIFFVKLNSNPEWSLLTIWLPLELKKAICTLLKNLLLSLEHKFSFRRTIVQSDFVQWKETFGQPYWFKSFLVLLKIRLVLYICIFDRATIEIPNWNQSSVFDPQWKQILAHSDPKPPLHSIY